MYKDRPKNNKKGYRFKLSLTQEQKQAKAERKAENRAEREAYREETTFLERVSDAAVWAVENAKYAAEYET